MSRTDKKTFVVTGATGTVGAALTIALEAGGHQVRAVSARSGIDLASSNLAPIFADSDGVFLLTPMREDMVAVGRRMVEAAVSVSAPRIVRLSAASPMHRAHCFVGIAHGEVDKALLNARPDSVVLRPHGFMQNLLGMAPMIAGGALAQPLALDSADALIDARDIAASAAAALVGNGAAFKGVYDLTGPAALSPPAIANVLAARLGWPITAVAMTNSEARAGLSAAGVPAWFIDRILEMRAVQEGGAMQSTTRSVVDLTGVAPRPLDKFVDDHASVFLEARPT